MDFAIATIVVGAAVAGTAIVGTNVSEKTLMMIIASVKLLRVVHT
jgi:hypothetical protein